MTAKDLHIKYEFDRMKQAYRIVILTKHSGMLIQTF